MVGPWQIPVADCAVTTTASLDSYYGEAMSIGERAPVALLDFAASARMAVAEALLNMPVCRLAILNGLNYPPTGWPPPGIRGEECRVICAAVKAVGEELCPALGLAIPVGKDSMSMKTRWNEQGEEREMTSPLSLVITAFARVDDVRQTVTPQLRERCAEPSAAGGSGEGRNTSAQPRWLGVSSAGTERRGSA